MPTRVREIGSGLILNWFLGGLGIIIMASISYAGTQAAKVPALEQRINECKENHRRQEEANTQLLYLMRQTREELAGLKSGVNSLAKAVDRIQYGK